MHHGETLRKYLKTKDYSQSKLLEISRFSKSKLYGLYKQSEFTKDDIEALMVDFKLPMDMFHGGTAEKVVREYGTESGNEWKEKYYALLEKYNRCLEDKDALSKEVKSKATYTDKPINK